MKSLTCVIVGGGYAGIHAAKAIRKKWREDSPVKQLRLILIDKQSYHLRKVLLFKPAAGESDIALPLARLLAAEEVQLIQGTVTTINREEQHLLWQNEWGKEQCLHYDILVVAVGSMVRQPEQEQGGIALTGVEAAAAIREAWRTNLQQATQVKQVEERQRLLTLAVAGAGISGIETAAELAYAMREEANKLNLDPHMVKVYLLNAQDRLFPEGSAKMGHKLERALHDYGVTVLHGRRALREHEGVVTLSDGHMIPVGVCVWTLGLVPNPALRSMGLPLTPGGQIVVDASYRVAGARGVYSIGDCAHIVDPISGQADQMTCKEATAQAARLGKIVLADVEGKSPAPIHQSFMDFYCVGLGPERGMVWTRKWGLDIILTGKLAWKIRSFTWNEASMLK
ncbi:NAD(P)/FAD-dependent oxidoreductase [Paenibacillus sp. 481]|uniref:NAD(P)/FAD-dependent oxidoreductase n=1 Tax=Paenibacillus sp. 481 TaxID=2835869 RepID=UPI001E639B41|nr:FAD-dependent oxidoreductase [Paenibacillus sp. 481]UHA75467.1 FAD-dependent oxidoreductase [Paenibacillus sp. 481]